MHIAIIMDGNGRWAVKRNLIRSAGSRDGAKAADATVRCAANRGVKTLTLYRLLRRQLAQAAPEVEALFGSCAAIS